MTFQGAFEEAQMSVSCDRSGFVCPSRTRQTRRTPLAAGRCRPFTPRGTIRVADGPGSGGQINSGALEDLWAPFFRSVASELLCWSERSGCGPKITAITGRNQTADKCTIGDPRKTPGGGHPSFCLQPGRRFTYSEVLHENSTTASFNKGSPMADSCPF